MIADKLEALGLSPARGLMALLVPTATANDASVGRAPRAIREQLQQWATINLEIAEAVGAAAHAEAENQVLAAELDEIAREGALIRAGLTVDAA